jgi:hypothetical protein
MFIRVKKIGPYEYLYLVENAREGQALHNATTQEARATKDGHRRHCRPS